MSHNENKYDLHHILPGKKYKEVEITDGPITYRSSGGEYIEQHSFDDRFDIDIFVLTKKHPDVVEFDEELEKVLEREMARIRENREKYEKLGKPMEQYRLICSDEQLLLSNFTDISLSESELEQISQWFATIMSICQDGIGNVRNILLLADEMAEVKNIVGNFPTGLNSICVYERIFNLNPADSDQNGINTVQKVLTHEYFHQFNRHGGTTALSQEWNRLGQWQLGNTFPNNPASTPDHVCQKTGFEESEYGKTSPSEEFCDSAAKAIFNRSLFKDAKKLEFFDQNFLKSSGGLVDVLPVAKNKIHKNEIKAPDFTLNPSFSVVDIE